jgi:AsmA family protein
MRKIGSRRSWFVALGTALILPVLALALAEYAGWPFLRAPLQSALAKQLQRPVQIDAPFGLRLFGALRLRSAQLVIGPPAQAPAARSVARTRGPPGVAPRHAVATCARSR